MATKTKAKTAAKKSVAHKPVATHKPAPAKAKIPKKKIEALKSAPPVAPAHHVAEEKAQPKPSASHRPAVESVSLIDKKHPQKRAADGEIKKKTTVLPPISRIRASLEAPAAPPPKKDVPAQPQPPLTDEAGADHHIHGSRRPRQNVIDGCDSQNPSRRWRSRRHYSTHRRLHR